MFLLCVMWKEKLNEWIKLFRKTLKFHQALFIIDDCSAEIKTVTSCSTHKIDQRETDKNQNTSIQIQGESSANLSCLQKYFAN